jgi:hypothetical protein
MAAANPLTAKLLDFSQPVDVEAVESTVNLFYGTGTQDQVRWAEGLGRCEQTLSLICTDITACTLCQVAQCP